MRGGGVVADFFARLNAIDLELERAGAALTPIRDNLVAAVATLRAATEFLADAEHTSALAGATPYLRMFGLVTGGWLMARQAVAATRQLDHGVGDSPFLAAKVVTARFYCEQILPQASGLLPAVTAGASDLIALPPEQF
jgi:hypothetical protein